MFKTLLGPYYYAPLLLMALAARVQAQPPVGQPDYLIYTDSLVNGWQNLSFNATISLSATSPVHAGTNSIGVTITPTHFGALYVHLPVAFDTTAYSSFTFAINGGPTGGQALQVFGILNVNGTDTQQTAISFSSPVANTWQQVTIPLSSLGVAAKTNLTGFWIQTRSSSTQPTFFVDDIRLVAATPPSTVHVAVNPAITVRKADARVFGLNTAMWDSNLNTAATTNLLAEMGITALRFPGGSNSDSYHWQTNRSDGNNFTWAANFDTFAQAAVAAGNPAVFITTNYGSGTATEAADWVTYANVTRHYHFQYWEVGNEVFGSWENDTNTVAHDPFTYATRFKDYFNAMKARDPSVKVGAVAQIGEDAFANNTSHPATNPRTGAVHNGWTPVMLATLKTLGVTPDFVIYHKYGSYLGDAGLLQQARTWTSDATNLRQQLTDYLGSAPGAGVELVCTETNGPITNNNGVQSVSLVTGLYYADSLGQLLQTEFKGCMWWDLRNGQTPTTLDPTLYAWRAYSDNGMVSGTPTATDRYPTSYVAKVTSHFAAGGDTIVASGSDSPLLSAFAARRADGSVSLMVINKHPTANLISSVAVANTALAPVAVAYAYGIPQDTAALTGVGSPDITQSTITNAGAAFTKLFPPYSVTVISLKPALVVTTATLAPAASMGSPYSQVISASGGATGGYTWALIGGALPPGIQLNNDGSLTGNPIAAGTYSFTIQAADPIGNFASQSFTQTIANLPFAVWLSQYYNSAQMANSAISGPAADPNATGLPNLLAFALNRSPLVTANVPALPSTIAVDPADQNRYLTLTYTRRLPPRDISYHLDSSTDLHNWTNDSALVQETSATDDGNGITETVQARFVTPVAPATPPNIFLRLRVTQP